MKTDIFVDEGGRLTLPQEILKAIGIFGKMSVQVEVVDNIALISATQEKNENTVTRPNRLVYTGALPDDWNSGEAVLRARERKSTA